MKKAVILLFLLTFLVINYKHNEIIIPDDAIRMRIISSDNSLNATKTKLQVKDSLEEYLNSLMVKSHSQSEAYKILNDNLTNISNKIANITNDFEISLGKNYFPEKVYNGVTYKSGYYDSLVITLGNGTGKNFWCVMYPPLCLIDSKESQNVNYKFLLKEVLEKYKA